MGDKVGDIIRNCVIAACFTCLVCAILGLILIRCIERESSRRQGNVVRPV